MSKRRIVTSILLVAAVFLPGNALALTGAQDATQPATTEVDNFAVSVLCSASLIACKGGSDGLPTADTSLVDARVQDVASNDCYAQTRVYIENKSDKPLTVYLAEPDVGPDGTIYSVRYDFYELTPGFSVGINSYLSPNPFVIGMADNANPGTILSAYSIQPVEPCSQLQPIPAPVRPYDTPVVRYKVKGCSDTRIELTLGKPLPQGVVSVQLYQKGFSPDDMSLQVVSLSARYQWQRLTLVMPIKNVPVFITVYDAYGMIGESMTVQPPKGCKATYDWTTQVPPMGK